jgi:hypothetical protein
MLRRRVLAGCVLAAATVAAGMVPVSADSLAPGTAGAEPGALVQATPVGDASLAAIGAREWRVWYASRSGLDDHPVVVSGAGIAPPGGPPRGGWPVIALAHGTTGVADDCAPSASPDLAGQLTQVLPLVRRGFVIAATDYEGLGTPGPHPYLVPAAEGRSVIDSVRAARALVPHTSTRWAVVGASQGGQAAWAADELAGTWGAGLRFLGAAAAAPVTDLAAALPDGLTRYQRGLLPLVLYGLQLRHPELRYADYLSGGALALIPLVPLSCGVTAEFRALPAADFRPRSAAAVARLRGWLAGDALPAGPLRGPMFVAQGTADQIVRPRWTDDAVRTACRSGGVIDYVRFPGTGHPALPAAEPDILRWLLGRFAGRPAPDTCPH